MLKNNFEVQILVNGHPVKEYFKDGKVFIEGKMDSKYAIKIKNNSYRRILAVPTVDGLSVIDGKLGSFDSRGYIIDGYSSETIYGWRKDGDTVASFYFSNIDDSYAEKSDKGGYQGVIGVAIFYEKESGGWSNVSTTYYPPKKIVNPWNPWDAPMITWGKSSTFIYDGTKTWPSSGQSCSSTMDNKMLCCSKVDNSGDEKSGKLATGWGSDKISRVESVAFQKEDEVASVFEIFYNDRSGLEKMGINFDDKPSYIGAPTAFPGEYCQPPKK